MFTELINRILGNPYILIVNIIGILGIISFIVLPASKKVKSENYLPFFLLALVFFYEDLASITNTYKALNQKIHEWLFDVPFKGWNLWVYNLFNFHVSKVLFLLIIHPYVRRKSFQKTITGLWVSFLGISIGLQWTGIEPIHHFQPIIYLLGNTIIIASCGLFFIDMITSEYYLDYDPLKMWIFWFITLTLFQSSLAFLSDVSHEYLSLNNEKLFDSLTSLTMLLYLLILLSIMLKLAAGSLNFSKKKPLQHV
ncbi:hypothetical protein [Algoriphagus sp. AK58]|uniref:hypothetical protein n=1 Tax=Algoriphagus sp. AK58 TaxID=1406877 RepID=UPI001650D0E3|nr:hypothetical protein [Algoriphagus sp. AK58]